ncbi:MAG: Sua5/YciO/YrdC/YwlC family protein, partial [Pirellulales bacterium]
MVRILDWKRSEDPRDVVHVVVQALAEGRLVLLPTETSYLLAAGGLNESAVQRLMQFPGRIANQPLTLLLRSPDEVVDYATKMSPVAKRVAARGWPGPLALELPADPDESLFGRLPETVRSALNIEGGFVAMQVPAHQAVADALQFLPGPIVAAELDAGDGTPLCEPQLRSEQSSDPSLAFLVDDGRTHFGGSATHLRIDGSCCSVARAGVLDKSVLVGLGQLTVLLVCTGNTCRSPMAETLLRAQLQQRFAKLFAPGAPAPAIAISAGLSAYPGGNASPEAM